MTATPELITHQKPPFAGPHRLWARSVAGAYLGVLDGEIWRPADRILLQLRGCGWGPCGLRVRENADGPDL